MYGTLKNENEDFKESSDFEQRENPVLIFSSPGQSPGRTIVLPPALASASALAKC